MAILDNEFGPDYTAVHFDLSTQNSTLLRHPDELYEQVQTANSVVQQYIGEEHYPLLIFTLPSGVQFISGNPVPSDHHRLQDAVQAIFYWNNRNGDAPECLEKVGNAIANGEVPQRAFQKGFKRHVPAQCRHCHAFLTEDDLRQITTAASSGAGEAQQTPDGTFQREQKPANTEPSNRPGKTHPELSAGTNVVSDLWVTLPECKVTPGTGATKAIRFPDGATRKIKHWREILSATARWLNTTGRLTKENTPLRSSTNRPSTNRPSNERYLVHHQPKHPTGRDFDAYEELQNGPLYVNTSYQSKDVRRHAVRLLKYCGVRPDSVQVLQHD